MRSATYKTSLTATPKTFLPSDHAIDRFLLSSATSRPTGPRDLLCRFRREQKRRRVRRVRPGRNRPGRRRSRARDREAAERRNRSQLCPFVQMKPAIVISIPDVPLEMKLDAIAAALVAVRDAHRDTMPPDCWAAINSAADCLAEATLRVRDSGRARLSLNPSPFSK